MKNSDLSFREPLPPQESVALAALFNLIHRKTQSEEIVVGQLAAEVNRLLAITGERTRLTPRRIGSILSAFALGQRCRSRHGWILGLDSEDVNKIHRLVQSYGIDVLLPASGEGENCQLCCRLE